MRCIGGSVIVTGPKFVVRRSLFMGASMHTSALYIKTARMRFSTLYKDGSIEGANRRTWSGLVLPEGFALAGYSGDYLWVRDVAAAARERVA